MPTQRLLKRGDLTRKREEKSLARVHEVRTTGLSALLSGHLVVVDAFRAQKPGSKIAEADLSLSRSVVNMTRKQAGHWSCEKGIASSTLPCGRENLVGVSVSGGERPDHGLGQPRG